MAITPLLQGLLDNTVPVKKKAEEIVPPIVTKPIVEEKQQINTKLPTVESMVGNFNKTADIQKVDKNFLKNVSIASQKYVNSTENMTLPYNREGTTKVNNIFDTLDNIGIETDKYRRLENLSGVGGILNIKENQQAVKDAGYNTATYYQMPDGKIIHRSDLGNIIFSNKANTLGLSEFEKRGGALIQTLTRGGSNSKKRRNDIKDEISRDWEFYNKGNELTEEQGKDGLDSLIAPIASSISSSKRNKNKYKEGLNKLINNFTNILKKNNIKKTQDNTQKEKNNILLNQFITQFKKNAIIALDKSNLNEEEKMKKIDDMVKDFNLLLNDTVEKQTPKITSPIPAIAPATLSSGNIKTPQINSQGLQEKIDKGERINRLDLMINEFDIAGGINTKEISKKMAEKRLEGIDINKLNYQERLAIDKKYGTDYANSVDQDTQLKENPSAAVSAAKRLTGMSPERFVDKAISGFMGEKYEKVAEEKWKGYQEGVGKKIDNLGRALDRSGLFGSRKVDSVIEEQQGIQGLAKAEDAVRVTNASINNAAAGLQAIEEGNDTVKEETIKNEGIISEERIPAIRVGGKDYTIEQFDTIYKKMSPQQQVLAMQEAKAHLFTVYEKEQKREAGDRAVYKVLYSPENQQYQNKFSNSTLYNDGKGGILGINDGTKTQEQINKESTMQELLYSLEYQIMLEGDKLGVRAGGVEGEDSDKYILSTRATAQEALMRARNLMEQMSPGKLAEMRGVNGFNTKQIVELFDDEKLRDSFAKVSKYIRGQELNIDTKIVENTNNLGLRIYRDSSLGFKALETYSSFTLGNELNDATNGIIGTQFTNRILFGARASISNVSLEEQVAKSIGHMIAGMTTTDIMLLPSLVLSFGTSALAKASSINKLVKGVKTGIEISKTVKRVESMIGLTRLSSQLNKLRNTNTLTRMIARGINGAVKESIISFPINAVTDSYSIGDSNLFLGVGLDAAIGGIPAILKRTNQLSDVIKGFDRMTDSERISSIQKSLPGISSDEILKMTKKDLIKKQQEIMSAMSFGNIREVAVNTMLAKIKTTNADEGLIRQTITGLQNAIKNLDPAMKSVAENTLAYMQPVVDAIKQIDAGTIADKQKLLNDTYSKFIDNYDTNFLKGVLNRKVDAEIYSAYFDAIKTDLSEKLSTFSNVKATDDQLNSLTSSLLIGDNSGSFMINSMFGKTMKDSEKDKIFRWIEQEVTPVIENLGDAGTARLTSSEGGGVVQNISSAIVEGGGDANKELDILSDMLQSDKVSPGTLVKFGDNLVPTDPTYYGKLKDQIGTEYFSKFIAKVTKFASGLEGRKTIGDIQKGLGEIIDEIITIVPDVQGKISELIPKNIKNIKQKGEYIARNFQDFISPETIAALRSKKLTTKQFKKIEKSLIQELFEHFLVKDQLSYKKQLSNLKKDFVGRNAGYISIKNYLDIFNDGANSTKRLTASAISKSNNPPVNLIEMINALIERNLLNKQIGMLQGTLSDIDKLPNEKIEVSFDDELFNSIASKILGYSEGLKKRDEVLALMMIGDPASRYLGSRRVQSAKETMMSVISSIEKGQDIDIHSIYFTSYGRKIINQYMEEVLKSNPSKYQDYLLKYDNAYKKFVNGESDDLQLIYSLFDESTGKLKLEIDGENTKFSIADFLLARKTKYTNNGIVTSPVLGLFRYLSQSVENNEFLAGFFKQSLAKSEAVTNSQKAFMDGNMDWYDIYNGLKEKITDILKGDPSITDIDSLVADILDPMLYSHRQYFDMLPDIVGKIPTTIEEMQEIIFSMIKKFGGTNSAYINKVTDEIPKTLKFKFDTNYYLKNLDYTETSKDFADYIKLSGKKELSMGGDTFLDYLYKFFGDGLVDVGVGSDRTTDPRALQFINNIMDSIQVNIADEMIVLVDKNASPEDKIKAIQSIASKAPDTGILNSSIEYLTAGLIKNINGSKPGRKFTPVVRDMLKTSLDNATKITYNSISDERIVQFFNQNFKNIMKSDLETVMAKLSDDTSYVLNTKDVMFKAIKKRINDMQKRYGDIMKESDIEITFENLGSKNRVFENFIRNVSSGKTNFLTYQKMTNKGYMKNIIESANKLVLPNEVNSAKKFLRIGSAGNVVMGQDLRLNTYSGTNKYMLAQKAFSNNIRKMLLNIGSFGGVVARDQELRGVMQSAISREMNGRVNIGGKRIFMSQFKNDVQTRFIDIISQGKKIISEKEQQDVLSAVMSDWQFSNRAIPQKFTPQQAKLYNFLIDDVISPLNEFRKFKGLGTIDKMNGGVNGLDYFLGPLTSSKSGRHRPFRTINTLFGHAMFMPVQDIERLTAKYDGNLAGFINEFMLNGVNDGALRDKAIDQMGAIGQKLLKGTKKIYAKGAVATAFLITRTPSSFFQQTLQQLFVASGMKKAYKVNDDLLVSIRNMIGGKLIDDKGRWNIDTYLENINSIMLSDKASYKEVQLGILSEAIYNISEGMGDDYAKFFIDNMQRVGDFMKEYGIKNYTDFATNTALKRAQSLIDGRIEDINKLISEGAENVAELIAEKERLGSAINLDEFNSIKSFINSDYENFKGYYDASIASHFVISNIKSMTEIPALNKRYKLTGNVTKNSPKFLFGLMKWSMSTTGRRGMKFIDAIDTLGDLSKGGKGGFKGGIEALARNMYLGEAKELEGFFSEIATMSLSAIKANQLLEQSTGQEYSIYDIIVQPIAAITMLFGFIKKGIESWHNYLNVAGVDGHIGGKDMGEAIVVGVGAAMSDIIGRVSLIEYLGSKDYYEAIQEGIATENSFNILTSLYRSLFLGGLTRIGGYKASGYNYMNPFIGKTLGARGLGFNSNDEKDLRKFGNLQQANYMYGSSGTDFFSASLNLNVGGIGLFTSLYNRDPSTMMNQNRLMENYNKVIEQTGVLNIFSPYASVEDKVYYINDFNAYAYNAILNNKKRFDKTPTQLELDEARYKLRDDKGRIINPVFDIVTKGMSPDNSNIGEERNIVFAMTVDKETEKAEFDKLLETYGEGKVVDTFGNMFKRFISDKEKMGSNSTVGELMMLYSKYATNAYLNNLEETGVATKGQINKFKKGDTELPSRGVDYMNYKDSLETNMLIATSPMRENELSIKQALVDARVKNDPAMPEYFQKAAGNLTVNLGMRMSAEMLLRHTRENGLLEETGPISSYNSRILNSIARIKIGDDQESIDEANKIANAHFFTLNKMNEFINKSSDSLGNIYLTKMSIASANLPIVEKLLDIGLDTQINSLLQSWNKGVKGDKETNGIIASTIDLITDASPVSVIDALDQATNKASDMGKKGKKQKTLNAKSPKQKLNNFKAKLNDMNKLATIAAKVYNLPGKFKYEIIQEGSTPKIKASPIEIPRVRDIPRRNNGVGGGGVSGKPRKFGVIKGRVLSRGGRTIKGKSTKISSN